jgi:putative transcriptional regulator
MTRALVVALLLLGSAALRAQDLAQPMILVAKPELVDPIYAHTVLVVAPLGGDQHVGFIVNRPTDVTLANVFPGDGPSQKVTDPVYLGGPLKPELVFALVERASSPDGKSLAVLPGLYAAVDAKTVDGIIREQPRGARFVSGFVAWREGELQGEIAAGAWYVLAPDKAVLHGAPEHLWPDLVRRSRNAANTI